VRAVIEQSCGCLDQPAPPDAPVRFFMHGTADPFAPYALTAQNFAAASSPKFFLTLTGAQHIQYGTPWLGISIRTSIDFFDACLAHDRRAGPALARDGNVAGSSSLQSG
jgi:hypothetical protein